MVPEVGRVIGAKVEVEDAPELPEPQFQLLAADFREGAAGPEAEPAAAAPPGGDHGDDRHDGALRSGTAGSRPVTVRLDVETRIEWVEVVLGVFERHCTQCGYDADSVHWMGAGAPGGRDERDAARQRHGPRQAAARRDRNPAPGTAAAPAVEITVEDEGEGFDCALVADPLQEENLLKDSGRGIFFMRQFMDAVTWTRTPRGGTRVVLARRRAPRAP